MPRQGGLEQLALAQDSGDLGSSFDGASAFLWAGYSRLCASVSLPSRSSLGQGQGQPPTTHLCNAELCGAGIMDGAFGIGMVTPGEGTSPTQAGCRPLPPMGGSVFERGRKGGMKI